MLAIIGHLFSFAMKLVNLACKARKVYMLVLAWSRHQFSRKKIYWYSWMNQFK